MTLLQATASNKDLSTAAALSALEYRSVVDDLLFSAEFSALANYRHHKLNRRQHALNVSWYAFLLARLLGFDATACARSGLLHDLYYYNFKDAGCGKNEHIYAHPQLALENARRLTDLTEREEDIILNHMWPMCPERRRHFKETYLVSCVDKLCCLLELSCVAVRCSKRLGRRALGLLNII